MADLEHTQEPVQEVAEPTPIEHRAMEQGWVPQDQWEGEPDAWRPAKEFVDRGELFKKIDEVKRENKQLRQGLEELGKHHAKVREVEYQRAVAALKAQKKEALSEGDADRVVEIDERLSEIRDAQREPAPQPAVSQPDPRFNEWLSKNSWYESNTVMKGAADEVARQLVLRGERDNAKILDEVEKAVKKEFPHKFTNPRRDAASPVEGNTGKRAGAKPNDSFEMPEADRAVMNKILRVTPGLTKEKYLEEYKATKG